MKHRHSHSIYRLPQPQSIQAIFFDVGFTLLEPSPSIPLIAKTVMERRGTPVSLECLERSLPQAEARFSEFTREAPHTWGDEREIAQMWERYFTELLRPCYGHTGDAEVLAAASDIRLEFEEATSYGLYPDVEPVLAELAERNFKLGVISDWGIALGMILRHFDLTRFFDFAVISAAARRAKPDPDLYRLALERADVVPDYAIHVGDSYVRDVLGARAMGIHGILIDRMRLLQPEIVDCPLVYDLYDMLDLLGIESKALRAARERPA